MKVVIIDGKQRTREYPLQETQVYTWGRPDEEKAWSPDIDLRPDKRVSRVHASIWMEDDRWWIQDSGSKRGTLANGREIKGLEGPTPLSPGTLLRMGDTLLMADPPKNRLWGCRQRLVVDFDCLPAIGYSLYHCAIPVISHGRATNLGDTASSPFSLSFSIPGYSRPLALEVPALEPGSAFLLGSAHLPFYQGRLEGQEGRSRARLEVKVDGNLLLQKDLWVLGLYEYPYEVEYRRTLASFVLPGSPIVQKIVADARRYLKEIAETDSFHSLIEPSPANCVEPILHALYNCLREDYEIRWVPPPPSTGFNTQVIRPPHRVVFDPKERKGEGTCMDLVLLMAACLESLGLQPVIVMTRDRENDDKQHAFLGCWSRIKDRFEPLLSDFERVNQAVEEDKLLLVECTGFSRWKGEKLSYAKAREMARKRMVWDEFLYTLDISASRMVPKGQVMPLDFSYSPAVLRIIQEAHSLARRRRSSKVGTPHLLYGFLAGRALEEVFARAGVDPVEQAGDTVANKVNQGFPADPQPSKNYNLVLGGARGLAEALNHRIVEEHHLLYVFLKCDSKNIDPALKGIGTDRQRIKAALDQYLRDRVGFDTEKIEETLTSSSFFDLQL